MIIIILCLVLCLIATATVQLIGKRTNKVNDVLEYYTVSELMEMRMRLKDEYNGFPWQDKMIKDVEKRLRIFNVKIPC